MNKPTNSHVGVILAIVAAAALAYACVAKTWLHNPRTQQHFEVGFGLVAMYECDPDAECRTLSNTALVDEWRAELAEMRERGADSPFYAKAVDQLRTSAAFPVLGWITLGCAVIGALSLVACAALVLARRRIAWPVMPTTTAILAVAFGLIVGCVFVALKPGPAGYVGVGLGFFASGAGVIGGLVAALMLNKHLRPLDEDLLADAMDPEHY